jgi:ribosomal protein S18 acetylase RimI-like enzyme
MRQGRAGDLAGVLDLWTEDVRAGRRDCLPSDDRMARMLAGFDWEAGSRIVDGSAGKIDGAVLVSSRPAPVGTIAIVEASVAPDRPELLGDLTKWGLGLSKAAGPATALVWRGRGHSEGLDRLGLELVRPWWRMDRSLADKPPAPFAVDGYELEDATSVPRDRWAAAHNLSFADHWRFTPRDVDELMVGRPAELSLMAMAPDGTPAALALSQIVQYKADARPQPVGMVSSVGTLPEHRRRGLATWLVAEALARLYRAGARHASLYVDGRNTTRAFDAYRKLGFDLAFESEVWEARLQ